MDSGASAEMPKYKCYKEVWALKIRSIHPINPDGSATMTPEEKGFAPITLDAAYMEKHKPQVGGYYVVYKDGYKSFSPAEAFEEGYKLISGQDFVAPEPPYIVPYKGYVIRKVGDFLIALEKDVVGYFYKIPYTQNLKDATKEIEEVIDGGRKK